MSKDVICLMLFVAQQGRCFHCAEEFTGKGFDDATTAANRWTRDHVNLASRGHGRATNTVLACGPCNHKRGTRLFTPAEMQRAQEIFERVATIWRAFYGADKPVWPDKTGKSVLSGVEAAP